MRLYTSVGLVSSTLVVLVFGGRDPVHAIFAGPALYARPYARGARVAAWAQLVGTIRAILQYPPLPPSSEIPGETWLTVFVRQTNMSSPPVGSEAWKAQDKGPSILIVCWMATAISTVFVLSRIYVRGRIMGKFQSDDYFVLLGQVRRHPVS